jgi:hypothetical protein
LERFAANQLPVYFGWLTGGIRKGAKGDPPVAIFTALHRLSLFSGLTQFGLR